MVTKKKSTRKRTYKRKRTYRKRKPTIGKMLHSKSVPIFTIHRISDLFTNGTSNLVTLSGPVGQGTGTSPAADGWDFVTGAGGLTNFTYFSGAIYGTLDTLPGYSDITNLFDQYRINAMELSLRPFQTVEVASAAGHQPPVSAMVYWCNDYDDAAPFPASNTGVQQIRERVGVKERSLFTNTPIRIQCKPRIAISAYGSGAFGDYASMKDQWLDCSSPDIQHYGIKYIIEVFSPNSALSQNIWIKPELTISVSAKEVI